MGNPLLQRASPQEFAARQQVIEKEEELQLFPRLAEIVNTDFQALSRDRVPDKWRQAPVAIRLAFGWLDPEHKIPALEGRVSASIPAVCQRCLEPFEISLATDLKLIFCGPGGGAEQAAEFDLWELDETTLRPLDILDEALVMAMPVAAMHESSDACGPLAKKVTVERDARVLPFADLKSQMRRKD